VRDAGGDLAQLRKRLQLAQTGLELAHAREVGEKSEHAEVLIVLVEQRHRRQADGLLAQLDFFARASLSRVER
jgi:hypothetical protein